MSLPPAPPSPSVSATHTEAPQSDSNEDEDSAEEDVTDTRKTTPITQMLDLTHEADLAEWWRDHPGLYDKGDDIYRRKEYKSTW